MTMEVEQPRREDAAPKFKMLCVALLGYCMASALWSFWRIYVQDQHNEFVSDGLVIIANMLGAIIWGTCFLVLPLLTSAAVNHGLGESTYRKAVMSRTWWLGLIGGLCMGGLTSETPHQVIKFALLYVTFFILAIFTFARTPAGDWVFLAGKKKEKPHLA